VFLIVGGIILMRDPDRYGSRCRRSERGQLDAEEALVCLDA
jgi:hypothetical protein